MPTGLLLIAALLTGPSVLEAVDPPTGTKAVEALLELCSDAGVIVSEKDPKTGAVPQDPKLGISKFIVPDEMKLRAKLRANKSLMENVTSRKALIGCAKIASREFAPGWVDLLRAVGREQDDSICVKISFNIAAAHELPLGSKQGFADLGVLINAAIKAEAAEYHSPKSKGMAWLTIRDEQKFKSILEANRARLGPGLIGAAANMSQSKCDHTPVLKAISALTIDPTAAAFAAEFAARHYRERLEPLKVAEELELAAKNFASVFDTPSQARVLTSLGQVRRELGEEDRALELFNEAYDILVIVHDGKHRDLANLHRLKAELFCDRNEVQRSLMAYMKAVTLFMELPQDPGHFADVFNMMRLMARIDVRLGHPDEAYEKLTDILVVLGQIDLDKSIALDTDPLRALAARELGRLEFRRGRLDEAKGRLDAALDIQMRLEGAVHPETIKTLFDLGQVCAARGEPGQSEFLTRQATIFLMRHYGTKHPAIVKAWSDRTAVHIALGNFRDAAEEIALGLKAARVKTVNDLGTAENYLPTLDTVLLLARRGELSLRAADLTKDSAKQASSLRYAHEHFLLAEGVFNRIRGNMHGDGDRLLAGDDAPDFFTGQLGCQIRLGKLEPTKVDTNAAFAIVERATARSLLESLGEDVASRLGGVPEALRTQHRQLRINLDTTLRDHNQAAFRQDQTELSAEQRATWEKHLQAQRELQQFEKRLAEKFPVPSREAGVAVCTPEQALESLGPNEVAVTFLTGTRESFAVVLSRGANGPHVTMHQLPGRDAIENQVFTLINPSVMDQAMGRQLGEALYDRLMAPLGQRITGKDLVIVPTGPLCRLPFELLRSPGTNGREYVGLTRRIRYEPSLTVMRLLQKRDQTISNKPELPLWAMGNPEEPTLPGLPRATIEVNTIARLLGANPASVRLGMAATKTALLEASSKGELKRHRILHFAVHAGFASEINPTPGLVLGSDAKRSGFMDMDEIAHLDINADLVVLSACTSGGGRIYGGEGIRGLTSSILVGGGRAVIATQWPLADVGADQFMAAFYHKVKQGKKPVDALWETRREAALQGEPRPPSEWAAFVLIGN